MQQAEAGRHGFIPEAIVTMKVALTRLGIGLAQGAVLYLLYRAAQSNAWPANAPFLFAPLLLVSLYVPVIVISSLGHLTRKQAAVWAVAAALVIAALGLYDIWRGGTAPDFWAGPDDSQRVRFPSPLIFIVTAAGLFVAHALVLAGAHDRRRIAGYSSYFEIAWKLIIQIKFSGFFVGALWCVLWLGAGLFMLVKIEALKELIEKPCFAIPATAFAASCAMHITDVRPAIVQGIRSLLLVLLSWILPIAAFLVAAFLLSLPVTGLEQLWATRHATPLLLGMAAALIILINAAFQNGEIAADVARVVRLSARVAALSLGPVVAIAIYALALRVNEYGWTSDRIIAAACLLVAGLYAIGYAWAACRRGPWLAPLAHVNVAAAFAVLAVLLGLFSPLADPARLSVNNQIARFEAGKIGADKFDYEYLRFDGARYGLAALERLKTRSEGPDAALVRQNAQAALDRRDRWSQDDTTNAADLAKNITVWPSNARLPESFVREKWDDKVQRWGLPACLKQKRMPCDAYLIDFNGDGKKEILLTGTEQHVGSAILMEDSAGRWTSVADLRHGLAGCAAWRDQLRAGAFKLIPPRFKDLEIAGQRVEVQPSIDAIDCSKPAK